MHECLQAMTKTYQKHPKANVDIMHGGMSPTIYLPLPPPKQQASCDLEVNKNTTKIRRSWSNRPRPVRALKQGIPGHRILIEGESDFFTPLLVGGANTLIQFCFVMVGLLDEKNLIKFVFK